MRNKNNPETRRRSLSPARLGFDHGWLRLSPTFLNLQVPGLLIDSLWTGPINGLGFEPIGTRDPCRSLPQVSMLAHTLGPTEIQIGFPMSSGYQILAWNLFSQPHPTQWWCAARQLGQVILFVGNTYQIELSSAAFFDCAVGLIDATACDPWPRP